MRKGENAGKQHLFYIWHNVFYPFAERLSCFEWKFLDLSKSTLTHYHTVPFLNDPEEESF